MLKPAHRQVPEEASACVQVLFLHESTRQPPHPATYSRFILALPLRQRQNSLHTPLSLVQSQRGHNTIDTLKVIWRRMEIMKRLNLLPGWTFSTYPLQI